MENLNEPGHSKVLSRSTINIVIACYFVLGVAVGWFWQWTHPDVLNDFHKWYYYNADTTWEDTRWLGIKTDKFPSDMWIYQEIITETKPDVLIEAGTFRGGSALFFATIFDELKHGRVLTIDITEFPNRPQNPRITYLLGSSTSDAIVQQVKASIQPGETVMVSLDSDHHKAHVLEELRLYSSLVTVGNYLVVEDTDINGHPVNPAFGPGPMEAVQEFLKTNSNFEQDRTREKFGVTLYPGGWLKKVR